MTKTDERDIDEVLNDEEFCLVNGFKMLRQGENGQCICFDRPTTPEIDIQKCSGDDIRLHNALEPLYGSSRRGRYRL